MNLYLPGTTNIGKTPMSSSPERMTVRLNTALNTALIKIIIN